MEHRRFLEYQRTTNLWRIQLAKGHKFLNKGIENIFNETTKKEQEIIIFITAPKNLRIRYSKEVEYLYNESFIIPNEGFEK